MENNREFGILFRIRSLKYVNIELNNIVVDILFARFCPAEVWL